MKAPKKISKTKIQRNTITSKPTQYKKIDTIKNGDKVPGGKGNKKAGKKAQTKKEKKAAG